LAAAAGVAIENARLHSRIQDLALLEDRERIARDLHDSVIQRLFAIGLSLQGAAGVIRTDPAAAAGRVEGAVDDLDLTVKQIRSAIFGLEPLTRGGGSGVRSQVLQLVRESGAALGFEPTVMFDGPVDSSTTDGLAADILATLREALSNVARHARAGRVDVTVAVDATGVLLRVADDGVGPPAPDHARGHGLPAAAARSTSGPRPPRAPSSSGVRRSDDRLGAPTAQRACRLWRSASRAAYTAASVRRCMPSFMSMLDT
jgi:signal transduction histidine kinase